MARSTEAPGIQTFDNLHIAYFQQDLRSGEVVSEYKSTERQSAASLAKLFIVASALKLVEDEMLDLGQSYHITPRDFAENSYGTGRLRRDLLLQAALSKTLGRDILPSKRLADLLRYSVQFSDNIATAKVADIVGRDRIQDIVYAWGLHDTSIFNPETGAPNETTAQNVGQFLYDFDHGFLLDDNLSVRFLRWMPTRKAHTISSNQEIKIRYKSGNITEGGFSYCHQAGYLQSSADRSFVNHSFVVLTRDKAYSDKDSTHPQQVRASEKVEEMVYQLS